MSDVKIPGGGVLGGILGGVGGLATPGPAKPVAVPPPPAQAPPADGFRDVPPPPQGGQLTGQGAGLTRAVTELAAQAEQIFTPQDAQPAFQAAFAVVREQLLDPRLPPDQLGQRANEFFTQFAQKFVQTSAGENADATSQAESQPEQEASEADTAARDPAQAQTPDRPPEQQRPITPEEQRNLARQFAESLRELGFEQLKNLANGKDGVENANELLSSENLKEFAALAKQQKISTQGQFPPGDGLSGPLPQQDPGVEKQELGENPAAMDKAASERARQEGSRGPGDARLPGEKRANSDDEDEEAARSRRKKGKNLLFGFLGSFRRNDENARQAEEQWNRVTVAALLFLVFVVLVTVALVSL